MRRTVLTSLGLAAALLGFLPFVPPAVAETGEFQSPGHLRSRGAVTSEASRKMVSRLRALVEDVTGAGTGRERGPAPALAGRFQGAGLRVDEQARVQVYVTVSDAGEATLGALRAHGLDVELVNAGFGVVQGWVPISALDALAGDPAVLKIRPPSYALSRPVDNVGSVASEGSHVHRCDVANGQGSTGAGIKVGVISDGVDSLLASQGSGNLPAVQVLSPGNGDEGTAMLEIVADCAPGASLAFSAAGNTSLQMANSVNALVGAGARVVVDDIVFIGEPQFEDGLLALNDRTAGSQVLRVSSSGNRGRGHYQGFFVPGVFDNEIPGTRHAFQGGDTLLRFQSPANSSTLLVLQWTNPQGGSGDDYDLCARQTDGTLIDCSAAFQDGNDDPFEIMQLNCGAGGGCAGDLQITQYGGSAQLLDVRCYGCTFVEYNNPAGSLDPGQTQVPEVLSVAASPASDPSALETFSSQGPALIFFPSLDFRDKVDVTGADGVSTSVPGFSPFFGTSAAAPHVAGVAAIVLGKEPALTPAQLRDRLRRTAIDLGPPGFDSGFGYGRADAVAGLTAPPAVANAVLKTRTNGTIFRTGQTVYITVEVVPGAVPRVVDGYVVIQTPGPTFLSVVGGGVVPGIVPIARSFVPFLISPQIELFRYTFTGFEPPGAYPIISGFTDPFTLNVVGTADEDVITFIP